MMSRPPRVPVDLQAVTRDVKAKIRQVIGERKSDSSAVRSPQARDVGDPELAERWLLDEWRQMWQQCLKTTDLRIVDVRVTENAGEVVK